MYANRFYKNELTFVKTLFVVQVFTFVMITDEVLGLNMWNSVWIYIISMCMSYVLNIVSKQLQTWQKCVTLRSYQHVHCVQNQSLNS